MQEKQHNPNTPTQVLLLKNKVYWLKYFLSYFYLITVKKIHSNFNPGLCIQLEAGKLLLNTTNANYSYGSLHQVFEDAFELIDLQNSNPKSVLVLGLGAGSVIDIMQRQYGIYPKITAIEIDPVVIECLKFWELLNLDKTKIIQGDAFEIIHTLNEEFDLIIVDLFIDMEVASLINTPEFLSKLKSLISHQGKILINYIVETKGQKNSFAEFQLSLITYFKEITGHEIMGINRVLELKI